MPGVGGGPSQVTIPIFRWELAVWHSALTPYCVDWPLRASVRGAGDQIMYNLSTAG